jgi:hypothetical protein
MKIRLIFLAAILSTAGAINVPGCRRPFPISFEELFAASVIVTAVAEKYSVSPKADSYTMRVPESKVIFRVEEVLRGKNVPKTIELRGDLSDTDDYNDRPVPYDFVRPGGRGGSCFANTYKKGASFLLFLVERNGSYTSNISALGPTNEQLRSVDDPWLKWTLDELKKRDAARR